MRRPADTQLPLAPVLTHQGARELVAISSVLDETPQIGRLAQADLCRGKCPDVGRPGMTGEQVVRVVLLKQLHRLTYRQLAFFLEDSDSFRRFARLPLGHPVRASSLQGNVKRLQPETWQAINRCLLLRAQSDGVEDGRQVRVDCTAVESHIHAPTDSSLLEDCVRVVTRLLGRLRLEAPDVVVSFRDHTKRAQRRAYAILCPPRGNRRKGHLRGAYSDLIKVARKTHGYGVRALERLSETLLLDQDDQQWSTRGRRLARQLERVLTSMARVIDQAERRVLRGEKVPVGEKLVSIFEPHTDVIVKGRRPIVYGHKVLLASGASSLILDCVVEQGNPPDSTLVDRTLDRLVQLFGRAPREASFDGGFASTGNLSLAKQRGVLQVAFHKKTMLSVPDMVSDERTYKRLRRFRAGIEACISMLKRALGMARCPWRTLPSFRSYVLVTVVSYNALVIARHLLN